MITLSVTMDEKTFETLEEMARARGIETHEMASRLFKRAFRAAQPKPIYDTEVLRAYAAEFEAEDLAFSEATVAEHAELLAYEDRA